jgi:hypothetical protein
MRITARGGELNPGQDYVGFGVPALYPVFIERQVSLVRVVRHLVLLQTDNFRLFLRQQADKPQTSVCMMSKR